MSPQADAPRAHAPSEHVPHGRDRKRLVRRLETAIGVLGVLFVLFVAGSVYLWSLERSLPDLDVRAATFQAARTTSVYAADGSLLAEWHGEQDRHVVGLDEIAKPMRDAVVAIEDERFYDHEGVDWISILRAARADAGRGAYAQGGSTITQQLVKLLFTGGDRTLGRKVKEALLAYQLESRSDKASVLETYLNVVYFGRGAYGVESAARAYFGKSAASLTPAEAALLAGVIRSPVRYSPTANPTAARQRRDAVLSKMAEQGYLTDSEAAGARRTPVRLVPPKDVPPLAPYFVEYVKQDLIGRLGADAVFNGGLRVYTTLDPALQHAAEAAAHSVLPAAADPDVAVVTLQPRTGHVLALVGGRDFGRDQFNLAVQGRRQPGSAFKPFVLVTALEQGITPQQVFAATPYAVAVKDGVWRVDNYENAQTSPQLTLAAATEWSVNAVFARLIMQVGPDKVVATAHRMGITSPLEANPAIALGGLRYGVSPLEMASAYGTLASGGFRVAPAPVLKVTDYTGRVIYEPKASPQRVVAPQVVDTASRMLHDVVEHGTGTAAQTGAWAAGKTGTTQSYRDAWFVGWSGEYATAVWVGYGKRQVDMTNVHGIKVTGGSFPALIWKSVMSQTGPQEPQTAVATAHLVRVRICADSMALANPRCPNVVDMYLPADEVPRKTCDQH